jgi:hypothetical protein
VRTWRAARKSLNGLSESDVHEALRRLYPLWHELFPAEQAKVIQLLVERIDVARMAPTSELPSPEHNHGIDALFPCSILRKR